MNRMILWLVAGACFYIGAVFTYIDGGRPLIWGLELLTGMLLDVVAVISYKRR